MQMEGVKHVLNSSEQHLTKQYACKTHALLMKLDNPMVHVRDVLNTQDLILKRKVQFNVLLITVVVSRF